MVQVLIYRYIHWLSLPIQSVVTCVLLKPSVICEELRERLRSAAETVVCDRESSGTCSNNNWTTYRITRDDKPNAQRTEHASAKRDVPLSSNDEERGQIWAYR